MKRILFTTILTAAGILIFGGILRAQDTPPAQTPKKVVIHTFSKGIITLPPATIKGENSFDYLASILALNIRTDIDKTGSFATEFSPEAPDTADNSFSEPAIEKMKKDGADKAADFVVAGIYTIDGKNLQVDCSVIVIRTGAVMKIQSKAALGVILDAIIANLADGVISAINTSIPRPAPAPSIEVSGEKVRFAGNVSITPADPADEVWYTLDGTAPSREKKDGRKYIKPFSVRESVKIRAVAYRDGFLESKQEEKEMSVRDPLTWLTLGFAVSTEVFLGKATRIQGRTNTSGMSVYGLWETAAVESLRSSAFFRSFGVYLGATAFGGSSGFSDTSRSALLGSLGAAWIIRAADFFAFQIVPMGGYAMTRTYIGNQDTSTFSALGSAPKNAKTSYDPWGGAAVYSNFNFASGVFTRLGITYRHVFYSAAAQTDCFSVDMGFGYRL
jgi:hypothetical protein